MSIEGLYEIFKQHPSVQTDTRKLQNNDLFFALKGPSFNGNSFAVQALEQGAAFAVIDDPEYKKDSRTILVPDVLTTLQQLALFHRQQLSIPVLAITGSNGKTTTKELIHAVLSSVYTTYTTTGNLNNHIGVPLTILRIKSNAQLAVVEMGANHQKEIASYCAYTLPTHGLITNCGKAHLEGFGGEAGVRKGKGELFDYLRQHNGTAFIMHDYDYLLEMSQGIANKFFYGTQEGEVCGHASATDPYLQVLFTRGFSGTVSTNLVGSYNLANVLAAVAVAKYFDVPEQKIKDAIENYSPSNSRSQLLQKGNNRIILDAYNANPGSMLAAVQNFAAMKDANKILILGAMAELGTESLAEHQAVVAEIKKHNWQNVLLVGGDFLKLQHPFLQFTTPVEAGEWIKNKAVNATLLIKGSRSMQMEKVLDFL